MRLDSVPAVLSFQGVKQYREIHQLQLQLVEYVRTDPDVPAIFLVVEHPPVFTLGRRGGREFLVVNEKFLTEKNIEILPIERGGVITYHGPGQLVVYPIIHLRRAKISVTRLVFQLEELMIKIAAAFQVSAGRDSRNHGVWVRGKKLGSIGIAVRHGVSYHGMALNVNPDLQPFSWIHPCGLLDVQMTSLANESGNAVSLHEVEVLLPDLLTNEFNVTFIESPLKSLEAYRYP